MIKDLQPPAVVAPANKVATMLAQLERANQNPQQAWLESLKEYKEVEPTQWAMPDGYKQRVAPEYLTKVYSAPRTGREYAEKWLKDRGLETCQSAKGMLDALQWSHARR